MSVIALCRARWKPDARAINDLTYRDLERSLYQMVAWLQHQGICSGDRICVQLPRSQEQVLLLLAIPPGKKNAKGYVSKNNSAKENGIGMSDAARKIKFEAAILRVLHTETHRAHNQKWNQRKNRQHEDEGNDRLHSLKKSIRPE